MKSFLPVLIIAFLITSSCSKNQRQVNRIDGKWNVIEAEIQGYGTADPDVIYEFEYCKLKHDDFCDFSVHNFETDAITTGIYSIDDSGQTLVMTVSNGFGFQYREYTIERLSSRKLILRCPAASSGEFSKIVMKKVP